MNAVPSRTLMAPRPLNRRMFLLGAGGLVATVTLVPQFAKSDTIAFPNNSLSYIKTAMGEGAINQGRITLDLPVLAETGNSVPITFNAEAPMPDGTFVKRIMMFVPGNPEILGADYILNPLSGSNVSIGTRIRLARTQNVYAVAQYSDNSRWGTQFNVLVTYGACVEDIFAVENEEYLKRQEMRGLTVPDELRGYVVQEGK